MGYQINHCGILILAAGQSKRLGSPKQLLSFHGETLISKVTDLASGLGKFPVICVLGAYADEVRNAIRDTEIHLVWNDDWEEGMASSIRMGVNELRHRFPTVDGIMILVCDQPFLDREIIENLLSAQAQSGLPAAAACYQGKLGTPALFHQSLFPGLIELKGDKGARLLLEGIREQVSQVHFDAGSVDIDSKEDYQRLLDQDK